MLFNAEIANEFAAKLLQINAIKLQPDQPFTWASGWKSPIYCDNRLTLSYPDIRRFIAASLLQLARDKYHDAEVIAGVATAGIAHGLMLADAWNKPFIYVRSDAKKHGLQNRIEGYLAPGSKVLVVEDLISTGGSSLQAVDAIRAAGGEVVGLVALFTYGFDVAQKAFDDANCHFHTLTNYHTAVQFALSKGLIRPEQLDMLSEWRKNPATWQV